MRKDTAVVVIIIFLLCAASGFAQVDKDALPKVEEGFAINFFVREPHIINPSSLCFDRHGRLYVGAGPQYRHPRPDSPTDYVKLLIDEDDDGVAEKVTTFAEGFNSIQAMAWKGNELWIANAPDLTVVRDTDGDDVADEYQIIYTGLNNLRHSLHGLNWGPDGWLYMTLGNTWVEKNAPLPFRQLQGIESDDKTKYPLTKVYTRETYKKSFHSLETRETEGGILRCRPGGHDLEIYARGMRNPWDICMDSGFNWLGTDNDPGGPADRIFMPVPFAHYTMRHAWMFDWLGRHIAIAPSSDLFPGVSGSGTGVAFYTSEHFPAKYRNHYLIADWANNCIFLYKPKWDGSLQVPAEPKRKIADGGATQAGDLGYRGGKGRSLFRPTDIEVGPDGALYIAGWGSVYGTDYVPKEKWTAEENAKYQGRVFRMRHKDPVIPRKQWHPPKRDQDIKTWSFDQLIEDMGHQVQIWRVDAQDELVRRGPQVREQLLKMIGSGKLTEAQATWSIWALGHIDRATGNHKEIVAFANGERTADLNLRIQATRILGENKATGAIVDLIKLLHDEQSRVRLAAIQSLGRTGWGEHTKTILDAVAGETDRLTFYTAWQVMRQKLPVEARRSLVADKRAGIRMMAALSLMEEQRADAVAIFELQKDSDERLRKLAGEWLQKTGARKATISIGVSEKNFREQSKVNMKTNGKYDIRYTIDGSSPDIKSKKYSGVLSLTEDATITAAAFAGKIQVSKLEIVTLHHITDSEWKDRLFVREIAAKGAVDRYEAIDDGLQRGVRAYAGVSTETITTVPDSIAGATAIRTSGRDANSREREFLRFEINLPATLLVAYDARFEPPSWLRDRFAKTDDTLTTSKAGDGGQFVIYKKEHKAGNVVLGGNEGQKDKQTAMYQVFLMKKAGAQKATLAAAQRALVAAKPLHGREIFFGRGTCFACHKVEGKGVAVGSDLKGINKRRDVNYVIRSILNPDEYIVEGYQKTSLQMEDGRVLFGMIQEETAQTVKMYLPTGERVVIRAKEIEGRSDAKTSGMPGNFAHVLSPQDVADLAAWIMTLK
jgi:putative membrane-bound dehydrogenase-like protein